MNFFKPCSIWPLRHAALLALSLGLSGLARAEALSFDDALELAGHRAPALAASAAQAEAARAAAIPAGELPDPKLVLGIDNLPVQGPDRFSLTRDSMTMQRIGVMQEFPNRSKRRARVAAAQGKAELAEAEERTTRLAVIRETALAWIARDTAERQLAMIDALLEENRLFEAALRARLAGGMAMAADIVAPRQEAAMIEERRDELRARREQAIATLRRWIGDAAAAPLEGEAPDWAIAHDSLLHRLHQHPELAAFGPKGRVLDAEIDEAAAGKRPDWSVELAYQRRGPQFDDMAMFQLSFDLPLFPASRQDPMIAARRAERAGLDAEREAALREHAAMLEADWAEYVRLTNALRRQREVLTPLAAERVRLATADWRSGRGGLDEVIMARRERIDAELKTIQIAGERGQMAARLHYAYGETGGEQP